LKNKLSAVMAGLVPAIHVFLQQETRKTWMPGTRPGMTPEQNGER
jgi:hypothetical protein